MTDASGNKIGEQGHYPHGESWYAQNNTTKWMFASYERDAESGNDYAMARQGVNRLGRFGSPDPLAGDTGNPQTLNKYSYVTNDPINLADPTGMNLMSIFGGGGGGGCDPEFYDCGEDLPGGGGIPVYGWVNVIENRGDWTQIGTLSPLSPPDIGGPPTLPPSLCGPICIPANPPLPPPPPGYDLCMKGLQEANKNFDSVQRALDNWDTLQNAGDANGIDPAMLAAIGVRESGFQNVNEFDGAGVGVGIFQITVGPGSTVSAAQAQNLPWASNYAASLLASNMNYLAGRFPNFNSIQLLQATAASYNMNPYNPKNFSGNPYTIDGGTAHGNYGGDILLLMNCFR